MTNSQENLTEDTRERRKLLKEIARAKRPEEIKEIRDKILERLDKKVATLKQLIHQKE